ncbi:hypothetical protein MXD61_04535 [Frankia sp. AgPm24]|uniref:hypothetical protein n=1 Tax=Frankia sp. AgPm24 TaxID=631128 RepID=UPI002010A798|nr:hypothetical protein [Frankia sp. AgPm24]MCK9921177.1 hypothetical protein [Frankia sp. AgPm24]
MTELALLTILMVLCYAMTACAVTALLWPLVCKALDIAGRHRPPARHTRTDAGPPTRRRAAT